jgi:hypothetical protein
MYLFYHLLLFYFVPFYNRIRRYLSQNGEKTKFQNVYINNSFLLIFMATWYATLQTPYGYLSRTPVSSVRVPGFRARRNTCLYITVPLTNPSVSSVSGLLSNAVINVL